MADIKRHYVFLCHSSEDEIAVRKFYDRLKGDGIDAWLAKKEILVGQIWEDEIIKAIKNSGAIIVFLSSQSVKKAGFVQKEIKLAVEVAEEKPAGTIFVIPARLDECDVPPSLLRYHRADLFDDTGYENIKRALRTLFALTQGIQNWIKESSENHPIAFDKDGDLPIIIEPGKRLGELRIERWELKNNDGQRVKYDGREATKEHIAQYAGITTKTLTKIEDGGTKSERKIIIAVLEILDKFKPIGFDEKREILAAFGYESPIPLPNISEVQWARETWQTFQVNYPAYLVDIGQRFFDWNMYAPKLLGLSIIDPRIQMFEGVTVFDIIFGLASQFIQIENKQEYLPALLQTIKSDSIMYKHETWFLDLISTTKQKYPEFSHLWETTPEKLTPIGNEVPIILNIPNEGLLKFKLIQINFQGDSRFFIVQWIPDDTRTVLKCLMWKTELESKV